jgi:NAD dependent epimerase/dehydratase
MSNWVNKKVLVTGAGGFIASHLVEQLVKEGARVRAFVRYNSRGDPGLLTSLPKELTNEVEIIAGDLRDLRAVEMAIRGISTVFHLGALIAIPYSYLHPLEVVETNIMGGLNILLAGRNEEVERIICASTSEVYGTALRVPIDENHPLQAQSPYSASKIGADKLFESFYCSYNLPIVIIRPFNTYGPRQSTRAVIPTIITQAMVGNKLRLGSLTTRRDFTYVSDTVAGFLRGGETPAIEGQTFNLGTGIDISIRDLVDEIARICGRPLEVELDEDRLRPQKSEVRRLISDNTRARQTLNWNPTVFLSEGLFLTYQWIAEHQLLYKPDLYQV